MPELPDLVVFAENLSRQFTGERIVEAVWHGRGGRVSPSAEELPRALVGRTISGVERWGKEICFLLDNGQRFCVHLMLSGRFILAPTGKHPHSAILTLGLERGTLTIQDPKGLVSVTLDPPPRNVPDALETNAELLQRLLAARPKMGIKAFLIDQTILRGIGNAYADEILWKARIHPRSITGKIPGEALHSFAGAVHAVLDGAAERIRREHPSIIGGEVRDFLAVHNPSRQLSPTGHPIRVETVSSKKTYFTDEQILYE